jgi:hypothetical protein
LTANALNAFGLSGNQAVRVADTLANASNLAQGGIADTALALRQAATAAEAVGVSFEDTTALLTLLAKNGLTGSDAGTALRTAFLRLVNPSKEANQILEQLNVNIRDINGNVRPDVFADFAAAQADLSVKTQQANAAIVFGQDAFRAYAVLAQEGTKGLTDVQLALRKTGTAAEIARARMVGLAGAQENLSNQLSALGETIGQTATPPLTFFVNELARFVQAGGNAVTTAKDVAAAFKEIVPPAPPGSEEPLRVFGTIFEQTFKTGNVIGIGLRIRDLLDRDNEETEETIKNGGVGLRDALESAGREAARGAVSFADQITGQLDEAFALVRAKLAQAQQAARGAALGATARGANQQSGLEEVFNQIVAGGGSAQAQIANLERQAAVQAQIIEDAGVNAAGVQLERRRDAQAKLASINSQITGIEESIAAEAQSARDEQDRIRKENQRAAAEQFLSIQEDARARQERLVGLSSETAGLQDDIQRRQGLRQLVTRQINALRESALDEKTKAAAIKALVAAKQATSDEINALVRTQAQQNKESAEAARQERLNAQEAFAQSVFDLTGNKSPLLRVIDAQLKAAIQAKNQAKKGSLAWLQAKTQINELLLQRKELLKDAEDKVNEADRFSGFDALQKAQGFAANLLGNLIPGFATAGLVGNVSTQQPITDPGLGFAAEVPTANQLNAANARGVRPVQVDTTNSLLRQILASLNGRQTTPPEIQQNRNMARAAFDTAPGGP